MIRLTIRNPVNVGNDQYQKTWRRTKARPTQSAPVSAFVSSRSGKAPRTVEDAQAPRPVELDKGSVGEKEARVLLAQKVVTT